MTMFVSNLDQLEELVAAGSKKAILLGGELVYMTHDRSSLESIKGADDNRYIQQPPRLAQRGRLVGKDKSRLYVAVERKAADYAASYKGQVVLAADQYLAYGLAQKGNVIVIGGGATTHGDVNIEVFVFTGQCLVDTFERSTPLTGYTLEVVMRDIIEKYGDHEIHWCAPLEAPPVCEFTGSELFTEVGDAPIRALVKRKLYVKEQGIEEGWGIIPAVAVGFAGFMVLAAVAGFQWSRLESERKEYFAEVDGYESAYNNSAQSLDLLRHRDSLLRGDNPGIGRVAMLDNLLNSIASIDDVLIHSVKVFADGDIEAQSTLQGAAPGGGTDLVDQFRIEFSVPQDAGVGAREQAEPLVAMLSHKSGMTVRVIDHAEDKITVGEKEKPYWRYKIGGGAN